MVTIPVITSEKTINISNSISSGMLFYQLMKVHTGVCVSVYTHIYSDKQSSHIYFKFDKLNEVYPVARLVLHNSSTSLML